MPKLTKRTVDALRPEAGREIFTWDNELRGFGVRLRPNGAGAYIIQYRNAEGRSRRLTLGSLHVLTPEQARGLAREKLGAVCKGVDPVEERRPCAEPLPLPTFATGIWSRRRAAACSVAGANR